MPEFARCVGGVHDGQWLTKEEFRKVEEAYEMMPIFAPSPHSQGFRFAVIKPRVMGYADVVLRLLNGYCPETILGNDETSRDWDGDLSDEDWSTGDVSDESE